MLKHDAPVLRDRLTELFEGMNGKAPTEKALLLWFNVLKEHPMPRVVGALDYWAKSKSKLPAPADIVAICNDWMSQEIEDRATKEKAQERQDFKRLGPTPEGKRLSKLILEMLRK